MDEAVVAYILHEALKVSAAGSGVLWPADGVQISVLSGPPAPARQQDHPPRRQGEQHPADHAGRGQTGGLRYDHANTLTTLGCY